MMTQETFDTFVVPMINNLHLVLPMIFVTVAAYFAVAFLKTFFD